ncbi:dihydrolipoamide dehydrogenase [Roseospira marina]|uniref:Dihydrolipoamide dehydrogenase n=1 Tax=Roseospira marina TaxID=140057 RepID=A0A5M6IGH0_9PROT|nr:FAD-dependent oxidoreductase [Roseospira marina]KAA5606678.1 dihydrolipoamide dehydrogenase [Roseospira marina]MBB4313911.1 pyruvate/2-oxoglutarate dehydrogenase complex dihydrolipoamide dehydrogenase (E3) component [Roseospira marina]MBB5087073.1 pyruvate/2-oxoglutarate dehydrogenase complex dihydrolipoamide dehydrogenase (E3) component [Roseospira marina]
MTQRASRLLRPDLCVIGAGSAGLTVAAGAAQMGASVVLVERGAMGGDCLNTGCVPSKALLAAAASAQAARTAERFGIGLPEPAIDFPAVMAHVRDVIAQIAPMDSVARFEGLGVTVLRDHARFVDARTVETGTGQCIRARRVVIATGSRPVVPPIPGLADGPFLTNETIFDLTDRPEHLVILGGGPIGCELAQAFRRLGSAVTLIEAKRLLGRDDPELTAVVRDRLTAEGVRIHEAWCAESVTQQAGRVRVRAADATGATASFEGSHLLVALGRAPVADALNLDVAGIAHTARGITVDDGLRTTNRRVYAIGDVTGGPQFTHVAGYHGALVLKSALFRLPIKASATALPHVTFTDPELAAIGLSEAEARARHGDAVRVLHWPFADTDRARCQRATDGLVKAVTDRKGRILGAAIVGAQAGDLLAPWILALHRGVPVRALATMVAPYPTLSETAKRTAGAYYASRLFSDRTRRVVRLLSRLG